MKFSVAIPTYNRPNELKVCIDSILVQSLLPNEIIIIDDGELSIDMIKKWKVLFCRAGSCLIYYRKDHSSENRGLSESKNRALSLARMDIIFILDDDVVLEDKYFEYIMRVWVEKNSDRLIGVGGIIANTRKKRKIEKLYNKLFMLDSKYEWDVNEYAIQVWKEEISEIVRGYYVHGGVSSYKLDLAVKLGFSTFSSGRTALEDVDFCLRAKKSGYFFLIEPNAKVVHKISNINRENGFLLGLKESKNRIDIYRDNKKNNFVKNILFYWAIYGWIQRQFLVAKFLKGLGMIKGLFSRSLKSSKPSIR